MDSPIIIHADRDLADLIPGYLEARRKDIRDIEALLTSGDYETVQRLGHSMKGSGGGYGFDDISAIGKSIEQCARNGNQQGILRELAHLALYLDRIEVVYD